MEHAAEMNRGFSKRATSKTLSMLRHLERKIKSSGRVKDICLLVNVKATEENRHSFLTLIDTEALLTAHQ